MKTNFTLMEYNTFSFGLNSNCCLLATVPAFKVCLFLKVIENCFCCEILPFQCV